MGQPTLRGIRKTCGDGQGIRRVDPDVRDGAFLVLTGPSGGGTNTTSPINLVDGPAQNAPAAHPSLWAAPLGNAPASAHCLGVRPERLAVALAGKCVPATVVLAEHLGNVSILHLKVAGVDKPLHAKLNAAQAATDTGASADLLPDARWALAFDAAGRLQT